MWASAPLRAADARPGSKPDQPTSKCTMPPMNVPVVTINLFSFC
jgi:hypothetical protein